MSFTISDATLFVRCVLNDGRENSLNYLRIQFKYYRDQSEITSHTKNNDMVRQAKEKTAPSEWAPAPAPSSIAAKWTGQPWQWQRQQQMLLSCIHIIQSYIILWHLHLFASCTKYVNTIMCQLQHSICGEKPRIEDHGVHEARRRRYSWRAKRTRNPTNEDDDKKWVHEARTVRKMMSEWKMGETLMTSQCTWNRQWDIWVNRHRNGGLQN